MEVNNKINNILNETSEEIIIEKIIDSLKLIPNLNASQEQYIQQAAETQQKSPEQIPQSQSPDNHKHLSISKLFTIFKTKQRSRSSSITENNLSTLNNGSISSSNCTSVTDSPDAFQMNSSIHHINDGNCFYTSSSGASSIISSTGSDSDIGNSSCIDSMELFKLSDDIDKENEMVLNQLGPDRYNDLANIFSNSHKNLSLVFKEINRSSCLDESDYIDETLPDSEWEKCKCCGNGSATGMIHTLSDYKHLECIGKGGYGVVCKFLNIKTQTICAIKTIKKDHSGLREINTLKELGGSFAVNINHTFLSPCKEKVLIDMELLTGGDCAFHLNDMIQCGYGFHEDITKQYIAETVLCLEYIHQRSIIHCDIKPNNIGIDNQGHIKLLDFGSAKKYVEKKPTSDHGILGSPRYVSPEVLLYEPQSPAVDFWSLGIVLFEMVTGTTPFIGDTPEEIFESILSRNAECLEIEKDTKDLIIKLLDPNPNTRIPLKGIKSHPYFNGINWSLLKSLPPIWKPNNQLNNFISNINGSCKINSF